MAWRIHSDCSFCVVGKAPASQSIPKSNAALYTKRGENETHCTGNHICRGEVEVEEVEPNEQNLSAFKLETDQVVA
jgi:hypothetical protein